MLCYSLFVNAYVEERKVVYGTCRLAVKMHPKLFLIWALKAPKRGQLERHAALTEKCDRLI